MARSDVHPVHSFESWQVWPGSGGDPRQCGLGKGLQYVLHAPDFRIHV